MIQIETLINHMDKYDFWGDYLRATVSSKPTSHNIHIAVFQKPYPDLILTGQKKIESRFSMNFQPPYRAVEAGDILLIKESGGPITGVALVSTVWFYRLNESSWEKINNEFKDLLKIQDPDFWEHKQSATYATLMRLKNVERIDPFEVDKKDRRGWVTVFEKTKQLKLGFI